MRGYQKRVVFLKNPKSDIFEEAYFVIKEGGVPRGEESILIEAERIISENGTCGRKKGRVPSLIFSALIFGAGFFSATLVFMTVMLII